MLSSVAKFNRRFRLFEFRAIAPPSTSSRGSLALVGRFSIRSVGTGKVGYGARFRRLPMRSPMAS
jgi:hypothetical protein